MMWHSDAVISGVALLLYDWGLSVWSLQVLFAPLWVTFWCSGFVLQRHSGWVNYRSYKTVRLMLSGKGSSLPCCSLLLNKDGGIFTSISFSCLMNGCILLNNLFRWVYDKIKSDFLATTVILCFIIFHKYWKANDSIDVADMQSLLVSFSVRALIATLLDVHSSGSRGSSLQSLQKEEITSFQVVCFPYGIFVGFVNFVLLCFLLLIGFKFCSHFTFYTLLRNIYPSFRKNLDPLRQHWVWDYLSVWE